MTSRLLRPSFLLAACAVVAAAIFAVLFWPQDPELIGTDMEGQAAPHFSLVDHRGQTVDLVDLQSKAVALTFIFTNCPDVCPLIINRMRLAYEELPPDVQENVAMVAITVDPERDDVETMRAYFESRGVGEFANWYGLTGDLAYLETVWAAYFVTPGEHYPADPEIAAAIEAGEHDHEAFIEDVETGEYQRPDDQDHANDGEETAAYWLAHTDVIYVIDPENNVQVLMRSHHTPDDLAHNLRVLAP